MLTIKHIHLDETEDLYTSKTARYEPGSNRALPTLTNAPCVHVDDAVLTGGTIFVMNDNGKTVARYDLGASPVPHLGTHDEPKMWRPEPAPTIGDPFGGRPTATCGGIVGPLSQDKVYVG